MTTRPKNTAARQRRARLLQELNRSRSKLGKMMRLAEGLTATMTRPRTPEEQRRIVASVKRLQKIRGSMDEPEGRKDPLFEKYYPPVEWADRLRAAGWSDADIRARAAYLNYNLAGWK